MPFTLDGQWIPRKTTPTDSKKPVKVRLLKRGKNIITTILNLEFPDNDMQELASKIKKKLGCGGAIKESTIEIQGDKVDAIKKILDEIGIKSF